jgi:Tfp pilus assembly protein PilO
MNTLTELEELKKKVTELEERIKLLERKAPSKKIITDYTSPMVQDYILTDELTKKKGGNF